MASGTLSRGRALKLMGAALLGGTLASLGIREAAADPSCGGGCKRDGKTCRYDRTCCSQWCADGICAKMSRFTCQCPTATLGSCARGICGSPAVQAACTNFCASHGGGGTVTSCETGACQTC
jgi:hypothetical protein